MRVTIHIERSTIAVDAQSGREGRLLISGLRVPMMAAGAVVHVTPPAPSIAARLYAWPPEGQTTEQLATRMRTWLKHEGHKVEG